MSPDRLCISAIDLHQVAVCKCNATMCYYVKHTVNGQWSCIYIASFKSDSSKCLSYSSIQTHGLLCLRGNFMFSICTWNADCRGWGPSDQRTTSLRSEWATVTLAWLTRHSMWGRAFSFSVALCIFLWNIWLTKCNHYQNASQLYLVKTAFSYFFHFGCVLILLKKNIWLSLTNSKLVSRHYQALNRFSRWYQLNFKLINKYICSGSEENYTSWNNLHRL